MNKDWDKAVIGIETWKECLRVLKPGAFAFIMSSPRQDVLCKMVLNLIDAGFETNFTSIYWTYASGFPKAKNLRDLGYAGFQPKPAVEVVLVVMKPLSEKSFTDQALANGKGVTWLDSVRIPYQSENDLNVVRDKQNKDIDRWNEARGRMIYRGGISKMPDKKEFGNQKGRFPANLLCQDDVLNDYSRYFDLDKWFEATFPFLIVPKASKSEKERGLDKWIPRHAPTHNYEGRDMSNPKNVLRPGMQDRIAKNFHPTVKPLKLMSWLITLGSRPNDIVLDPFCGSGTTCIAAKILNRSYIGIELDQQYIELAETRIQSLLNGLVQFIEIKNP